MKDNKYGKWIVGGVIVIALICLVVAGYLYFNRSQGQTTTAITATFDPSGCDKFNKDSGFPLDPAASKAAGECKWTKPADKPVASFDTSKCDKFNKETGYPLDEAASKTAGECKWTKPADKSVPSDQTTKKDVAPDTTKKDTASSGDTTKKDVPAGGNCANETAYYATSWPVNFTMGDGYVNVVMELTAGDDVKTKIVAVVIAENKSDFQRPSDTRPMIGKVHYVKGTPAQVKCFADRYEGVVKVWIGSDVPSGYVSPAKVGLGWEITSEKAVAPITVRDAKWQDPPIPFENKMTYASPDWDYTIFLQGWNLKQGSDTIYTIVVKKGSTFVSKLALQGQSWGINGGDRDALFVKWAQMANDVPAGKSNHYIYVGDDQPNSPFVKTIPSELK